MRRAAILALGAWIVATATATVVSWLGVGAVTRAVTASAEPAIPHTRLAAQSPATPAQVAAPPTTTTTAATTTTVPPLRPRTVYVPATRSAGATVPTPTTTPTTLTLTPTTTTVAGPATTSTQPASTSTSSPPASTPATYSSPGGQITVRCSGDEISLLSALPANGYQLKVNNGGPKQVTVSFSGNSTGYQISAVCQNGNPVRVEGGSGGPSGPTSDVTGDTSIHSSGTTNKSSVPASTDTATGPVSIPSWAGKHH
jgi:hypothetical protein